MTENKTHEALSDAMNNLQEGAKGFRKNLQMLFTGSCRITFHPVVLEQNEERCCKYSLLTLFHFTSPPFHSPILVVRWDSAWYLLFFGTSSIKVPSELRPYQKII